MPAVSRHISKPACSRSDEISYVVLVGENPSMWAYVSEHKAITNTITKAVFILVPAWIPFGLSERRKSLVHSTDPQSRI